MTIRQIVSLFLFASLIGFYFPTEARNDGNSGRSNHSQPQKGRNNQNQNGSNNNQQPHDEGRQRGGYREPGLVPSDDQQIIEAMNSKTNEFFIEGSQMVVTKLLPDDRQGLKHQKWMVRLTNGQSMLSVYNLDLCERVPLKVGDVISMGGQFIWTSGGGLLHWLHADPKKTRPAGYVELNGKFYCRD